MIKDLELIYDIAPLFEKELIVWKAGKDGKFLLEDIIEMGAGKKGITVCDSDPNQWGKDVRGMEVKSPYMIKEYLKNADLKNISICIAAQNSSTQDAILCEVEKIDGGLEIYTSFGIKCGVYYGLRSPYLSNAYKRKKIKENTAQINQMQMTGAVHYIGYLQYFAFSSIHNNEIIMVYQSGKVGSSSVYASIRRYGRNAMHFHHLKGVIDESMGNIQEVINRKAGKIISMVREPVSRAVSYMWNNIDYLWAHGNAPDMKELEDSCFGEGFENFQSEWFESEMKKYLGINVLEYPFDREKGYQVIKSGNIELLLMKMERLNELVPVIGEFLGISDFQLYKANIGEKKPYRFAYEEYRDKFSLPFERVEAIFTKNEFVKHFYTEEECTRFMQKYTSIG